MTARQVRYPVPGEFGSHADMMAFLSLRVREPQTTRKTRTKAIGRSVSLRGSSSGTEYLTYG